MSSEESQPSVRKFTYEDAKISALEDFGYGDIAEIPGAKVSEILDHFNKAVKEKGWKAFWRRRFHGDWKEARALAPKVSEEEEDETSTESVIVKRVTYGPDTKEEDSQDNPTETTPPILRRTLGKAFSKEEEEEDPEEDELEVSSCASETGSVTEELYNVFVSYSELHPIIKAVEDRVAFLENLQVTTLQLFGVACLVMGGVFFYLAGGFNLFS